MGVETRVYRESDRRVRIVIRDPRTGSVVKLPATSDRQKQKADIRQALEDLKAYRETLRTL
jgi:hypothetical protein